MVSLGPSKSRSRGIPVVIAAALALGLASPSQNVSIAEDLAFAQRVSGHLRQWNVEHGDIGNLRNKESATYEAIVPAVVGRAGVRPDGPAPEWSEYRRNQLLASSSGAEYRESVRLRQIGNRMMLVGIGFGPASKSGGTDQDTKWLFAEPTHIVKLGESFARSSGLVHPSYELVARHLDLKDDGPMAVVGFSIRWRGFESRTLLSMTIDRADGQILDISLGAILRQAPSLFMPFSERDAFKNFVLRFDESSFTGHSIVRISRNLMLHGERDYDGVFLVRLRPHYEYIVETTNPDGTRMKLESWSRYIVYADTGEAEPKQLVSDRSAPSPLVYQVPQFEFRPADGRVFVQDSVIALTELESISEPASGFIKQGWYSQGDFLFPVAYNEATGEMEIRTPDQVRYYRLPPGAQTQGR